MVDRFHELQESDLTSLVDENYLCHYRGQPKARTGHKMLFVPFVLVSRAPLSAVTIHLRQSKRVGKGVFCEP